VADDFTELNRLAADLTRVPDKANRFVKKALEVTARNVKDDWRQGADRSGLGGYAADIDYDLKTPAGEIVAEVGPTIGGAGSFGFVEDGGGNVRSAPQHAARDALRANEDDFVRGLEIAVFDALAEEI
jgi:hypothetical protein